MYGYIYKTTNLITGKIYVGQHKASAFDSAYYGSGFILKQALLKYGKENFSCEVLEWCSTKEQLESREIYWISALSSCDSAIGYNISAGGFTPRLLGKNHPMFGKHQSLRAKEKNRQAHLGKKQSAEIIEKRIAPLRGKHLSPEHRKKIGDANRGRVCGDRLSDDGRRRISEASRGRVVSESTRKKIRLANLGRKLTVEHRQKLSESHKGQPSYWQGKHRDIETRQKISNTLSAPRPYRRIQYEIEGIKFDGLNEGAKYYNITKSSMSLWIKRGCTVDKKPIKILVDNQLHKKKFSLDI